MRKIFSFFIAILFASSMMAEVGSLYYTFLPYKPSSGAVSDYTKTGTMTIEGMNWTVPGNWYATGGLRLGGKSLDAVDRTIIAQNPMGSAISKIRIAHAGVTSDKIVLNSVTVTTASDADFTQDVTTKTVTDFTITKNGKDTIDVVPATEPWATNSYYKIAFNFTNSVNSNYAFVVESIMFYAYAEGGGDDPQPTTRTIYLNGGGADLWNQANALFFVHAWGGTGADVKMTLVEGDVYSAAIPSDNTSIVFVRMAPGSEAIDWDTKWNQSTDQTIPSDKDLFTMTDWSNGTWSVYGETPEQPEDPVAVVLPATLDVTNVSFRSEGMPDFVIEEGQDYAGTYFDMGAHDSANDTLLYAEWNVTIEPIKYNIAVDVYNTNSWRVQLYLLNQAGDTLKSLRYKGSSGQKGQYAIGSLDLSDLAAGDYKVRVHAATAWSAMKLKDVIFAADYQGVSVDLPGTLLPAYAELSNGASATAEAIAFAPSTANTEYATWNVSFAEAGNFDVTIAITASNGHNYGVTLLSADGATEIGAVNEGGQHGDTGEKTLGAIAVPAAGNYIVKLTNSIQWSEALLNSITFAAATPETRTIYLNGGGASLWNQADAVFFVHAWGGTGADVKMTLVEGDVYSAAIPSDNTSIVFVRMAPGSEAIDWDTKWNQSADQTIPADKDLFTMTDWSNGTWSVYGETPEQPEQPEMTAIYDWAGEIGTTVLGADGVEVTTVKINTNTKSVPAIKFGSSYAYAGGKWLAIKPANSGFKAGDVLSVAAVFNNADDTKYAQVDVYAADGATRMFRSDSASTINGRTKADDPIVQTYTLASDQDSLLLGRYGNTSMFVTLLKVERAAGEEPEQPEVIVLPVVKLAGSLTSWEEPVLMANAEDSLSATLTLNLGIDHYQLKVVSDDNWLTRAGEGDLFTMHRDYPHVDHLNLVNTGDNIKLITDVEGAYTFTWTYADSSLVVTFPEAPAQPKFYITGNEDIVGEGNPTWGKNGALESFSDTLVMNLAAGFHKFKLITPAEQWLGMEALTDTAYGLFTDDDTNICFNIAEAGEVTVIYNATEFKVEGNFYIAPVAKYYLIGDSAFVVDAGATADKAWTPDAIASFNDTTVLNLKAGVDYIMRLSLEGTWENHRDFRHLTDTAAGLIELPDEFQNRSIGFRLNEAGPVTIIYIPAAEEQPEVFKLIGDFYVAPAPDPTVSVFGTMTDPAWTVEVPFTLSDDKSYATLTVPHIGADEYDFKFFVNGEWRSNGYRFHREFTGCAGITGNAEANMTFEADVDGQYTFTWFFANDSLAISYPELPFACDWENIAFLGDGSPEQTHGNQFKLCKEGEQPGVVNIQQPGFAKESGIYVTFPSAAFGEISLPEGTYAIQGAGMILYCSAFDAQQETEVTVVCDNNPIVFTIYNANYTPAPPTGNIRLVPGVWNVDGAKFAAVTWHVGEAFENGTVSAWFEYLNADTLIGNVPNDADSIAFARFNSAAEAPSMDMNMIWNHTDKLLIDKQTMIYTISGWPEEGRDFCPGYWGEYIEPVYTLTNGYYLVGKFGGVDAWSVEDLSAEKLFAQNPDNNAEYKLPINLAVGDEIKVVEVENDAIKTWFPNEGGNYVVDQNHAGATTMYFRPDYQGGEGWFANCIFVVPTGTVDITNIDANAPAVKAIRNGQLFIIKGEKTYNAQGTLVK